MTANAITTVDPSPPPPENQRDNIVTFRSIDQSSRDRFTDALREHHRTLLIYTRSIVFDADQARDIVQEASITGWTLFHKFDPEIADFGTWMRGILRNKIRDWVKSKKGGKRPEVTLDQEHLDFLETHFQEIKPSFRQLKSCIKKLPQELSSPIRLTYYQGQNGKEASSELGIQPATLRKRLSRARLSLYECLNKSQ